MDEPSTNTSSTASAAAASRWSGKTVEISGRGGVVCMILEPKRSPQGNEKEEVSYQVQTRRYGQKLVVERVFGPWIAFRVKGTHRYLTQHLYDEEARNSLTKVLLTECNSVYSILLPELIPPIVEYAIDQGSDSTNFEGAGFCYQPMTVEPPCIMTKKPSLLQQFTLVEPTPQEDTNTNFFRRDGDYFREANGRYLLRERRWGIRSRFGKYWRSQHWDSTVSQSSHLLGDEEWTLSEVDDNTSPT